MGALNNEVQVRVKEVRGIWVMLGMITYSDRIWRKFGGSPASHQ